MRKKVSERERDRQREEKKRNKEGAKEDRRTEIVGQVQYQNAYIQEDINLLTNKAN